MENHSQVPSRLNFPCMPSCSTTSPQHVGHPKCLLDLTSISETDDILNDQKQGLVSGTNSMSIQQFSIFTELLCMHNISGFLLQRENYQMRENPEIIQPNRRACGSLGFKKAFIPVLFQPPYLRI